MFDDSHHDSHLTTGNLGTIPLKSRDSFFHVKPPERDPAKELNARLWKAHAAWLERHRASLSQARIAEEVSKRAGVGVDQTTVGTWFKGTPPKPWFLRPLADLYEVRFLWFVENDGPMLEEAAVGAVARERSPRPPAAKRQSRVVRDEKGRTKPPTSPRKETGTDS